MKIDKQRAIIAAKDCMWMVITGGLYFFYILLKILFTTPEGQKAVEKKIYSQMKAMNIITEDTKKKEEHHGR